ncbi:DUF4230 domain-containing protein [Treponema sp. Marseille-Q4523]|uniref:DUF4230 domain-containing protein n=1 Tax=Treponema sp. Marseille-Q4523 TaxID=2810610 RepID=UPI00196223D4|nr:DUF4230 domain-containing protein [Treponema sp. Marseille-Q4523]MBM7023769.1 DUF4230 domain-containing protein [Treponema sp. Marseille-Q4523]
MKEERTSVEEKKRTAQSAAKKIIKAAQVPVRRLLLKIIFAALLLCVLGAGAYFGRKKITEIKLTKKYMRIERQLVLCRELVTVKLRYSEIVSIKKSGALGVAKSYSIVKYSGVARAGIADVSKIAATVSKDGKSVSISLPKSELLGNEIASQEIFDEKRSIFVPITMKEIFDGIEESRASAAERLVAEGLLDDADVQARAVLRASMTALGFENVTIR